MHKLEAVGLIKTIKKTPIVRGMSLEVKSGEVVVFWGQTVRERQRPFT